ncbi:MAG TPA: futalosine hydrolase [Chitinophagaceae bacterium]
MNILLASATTTEIKPFIEQYRKDANDFIHSIDVLITGIGLTAATYSLTKQLHVKRPDLVIQAGIAGCFDRQTELGEVVLVKQDIVADLLVIENKKPTTLFDLGLIKPNQFPFSQQWLVNKSEWIKKLEGRKVKGISANEITTNKKRITAYKDLFDPVIESMEGAALHYSCLSEKIPFLQIRAISNYVGERNKKNWKMKESITNLNKALLELLKRI